MRNLIRKWWPPAPDRREWSDKLSTFYAENSEYHDMTAAGNKVCHPQSQLLLTLVEHGKTYAEVGCGGGEICGAVAKTAEVRGFDISPMAIGNAQRCYGRARATFEIAPAENIPLPDSSVDGAYSFEVVEHLWNPVAAIQEMARITKPGGFMLLSCPNHFSLDLHLHKDPHIRFAELLCAAARYIHDTLRATLYVNLTPAIDGPRVYPDCDMIASLVPFNMPRLMGRLGYRLAFMDTFYMCAHNPNTKPGLRFQRTAACPFVKWFGDHILLLAIKTADNRPNPPT